MLSYSKRSAGAAPTDQQIVLALGGSGTLLMVRVDHQQPIT